MQQLSFYAALLLHPEDGSFSVYVPALEREFKINSPDTVNFDMTSALEQAGMDISPAVPVLKTMPIMQVIVRTRRYLKMHARSIENFMDVIRITVN